ncbi:MAG: EAL domain-containing protein [bacterium]|nr:EAL domain-containing protein [bacterium]
MTTPFREDLLESGAVSLRTQLLQFRASLYDPETTLPTLPVVLDGVRRLLDERGVSQVLLVRIEQEMNLESVVGWERYDHWLQVVAQHLLAILADSCQASTILCQDAVRGDRFLLFCADRGSAARITAALSEGVTVVEEDTGLQNQLGLRVGRGNIRRRPAQRVERCIYAGIADAQIDFDRRGEELDDKRRQQLRTMLRNRDVRTLFQPIFILPERTVAGYEALSRGPAGTYLEPAENLFAFAERAGLLGEVELLCVEEALKNGSRLSGEVSLFVNLSFQGLEYLENVRSGLSKTVHDSKWSPTRIVVEITERTYAENPEMVRGSLAALRDEGFRIAIDDMGTGYSSLNVVADLMPDFIKLDQMLVKDLASEPIKRNLVSAITNFAKESETKVIAEGVERRRDADALLELGVFVQQGYFYGYPKPV